MLSLSIFSSGVAPEAEAPVILSGLTVDPSLDGSGYTFNLFDVNEAMTVYWVLVPTGATAPNDAQVIAGQDGTGTAAADTGSFATGPGVTPVTQTLTAGLTGSYDLYVVGETAMSERSAVYGTFALSIDTGLAPGTVLISGAGPANGTGQAQTATLPAHDVGDILGVAFISRFANTPPTAPAGWTQLTTAPYDAPSGEDLNLAVYTRTATSAAEANPSFADVGAVNFVAPFVVVGASAVTAIGAGGGQTSTVTVSGGTTSAPGALVVEIVGNRISGQTTAQLSGPSNGALSSLAVAFSHQQGNPQGGVGIDILSGSMTSAGAVGDTTASLANAAPWAAIRLEFTPQ